MPPDAGSSAGGDPFEAAREAPGQKPVAPDDTEPDDTEPDDTEPDDTEPDDTEPDDSSQPDREPPSDHRQEDEMTAATLLRPPVSPAAHMLLDRSREGLLQAIAVRSPAERYVAAHLSALRAAAAVLAVRSRPSPRGGPRSVWEVLPKIAPELTEWSAYFAATASRRAAVEAGRGQVVTSRAADDLLRDAEAFHQMVAAYLGLPVQQVLPDAFPPCE